VPITGYSVGLKRILDHQFLKFGVPAYLVDRFIAVLQSENSIDDDFAAAFNVTLAEVEVDVDLAIEMRNSPRAFSVKETVKATAAEFLIFSAFSHLFSCVEHENNESKLDVVETRMSHVRALQDSMMEVVDEKTKDKLLHEIKLAQSELLAAYGAVEDAHVHYEDKADEEARKGSSSAPKESSLVLKENVATGTILVASSPTRKSARQSARTATFVAEIEPEVVAHAIDESVIYIVCADGGWFTCMCENDEGPPTKKLVHVNAVADKHVKTFARTKKSMQTNHEKVIKIIDLSQKDELDQAQLSINLLSNIDAKVMLASCLLNQPNKTVDIAMTIEFFNRINVADSMPLFGEFLKTSEVVKRRSAKYNILKCSCSDTELSEDFQIGAYFTSEAKQILGVFAKRFMKVSTKFRELCLEKESLALKGIPFSLYKLKEAGFSLEKLLALGVSYGGMRSQFVNEAGTVVILSLGASIFTCTNSAGNPGTSEARKFQKMEFVEIADKSLEFLIDDSTRTFLKMHDLYQYTDDDLAFFIRSDEEEGTVDNLASFLLPRIVLAPIVNAEFAENEEIFASYHMPGITEGYRVLDDGNSNYDSDTTRLDCHI
jgi:hypothetical protein